MQMWGNINYNKRAVYYCSYAVQDQARDEKRYQDKQRKKWDYNFDAVYVVSFLNFRSDIFEGLEKGYVNRYVYTSVETGRHLGDGTHLVFVDLAGFRKEYDECSSELDRWLYSLKYIRRT